MAIESVHLQQGLRSAPPPRSSVASHSTRCLLPFRDLWRSQSLSRTYHRRQKRNGTLARDALRNQEKHRCASLLRPSPTLSHHVQEIHHLSSCSFCQIQWNFGVKAIAPLLSLPCNSLLPSPTPSPTTSAQLVLWVLHLRVTLPVLCPRFPLLVSSGLRLLASSASHPSSFHTANLYHRRTVSSHSGWSHGFFTISGQQFTDPPNCCSRPFSLLP